MYFFGVCKRVLTDVLFPTCRQGSSAPDWYTSTRTSQRHPGCSISSGTSSRSPRGWEKPLRSYDGHPSSMKGGSAFTSAATHCRSTGEYQFFVEARSARSSVLLTTQCSVGRLESLWWSCFVCLVKRRCMVERPNTFLFYILFDVMQTFQLRHIYIYIQFWVFMMPMICTWWCLWCVLIYM